MQDRQFALDHVYKLFSIDLNICGCGNPESAYDLVRDLLFAVSQKAGASLFKAGAVQMTGSEGAYHLIYGMLDGADLVAHGLILDRSYLTAKGVWYLHALQSIKSWDELHNHPDFSIGLPHDGIQCQDECWKMDD